MMLKYTYSYTWYVANGRYSLHVIKHKTDLCDVRSITLKSKEPQSMHHSLLSVGLYFSILYRYEHI